MGRVFGIQLEGPVYTCKQCHTHLGVPSDIILKEFEESYTVYVFSRLFNTIVLVEPTSNSASHDVFCVGCSNDIGVYSESEEDRPYWVLRSELHGPEGSDDEV